MANVNIIVARRLAAAKLAAQWPHATELNAIESDMLFRNIMHNRYCVQKKCLCHSHLSELVKERKIEVCA